MATNLAQGVADLALQMAVDQIAQDIKNNEIFAKKEDVKPTSELTERLLTLEAKVSELIRVVWVESAIEPLDLSVNGSGDESAFTVRLTALEAKVSELEIKTWKQEPLNGHQ